MEKMHTAVQMGRKWYHKLNLPWGIAGDQGLLRRCMLGNRNEQTDNEMIQERIEFHIENGRYFIHQSVG